MIAFVLMALAAICFLLRTLKVGVGSLDLIAVGLLFLALAFLAAWYWGTRARVP